MKDQIFERWIRSLDQITNKIKRWTKYNFEDLKKDRFVHTEVTNETVLYNVCGISSIHFLSMTLG